MPVVQKLLRILRLLLKFTKPSIQFSAWIVSLNEVEDSNTFHMHDALMTGEFTTVAQVLDKILNP